ncbi:bifunctional 4-hydroxy-2-oxoglutarate aldolase/2-dehydro-3-deoxy-phosphogluconate aldolase [Thalassomonas sp. M1454]|uniref:bifunctional 4-hydroxy-2-oxoglutarate aldolase/2-dehydro-3-deoxy-phosphogluconate aldolase n=1 Tax=Thalassomonas sp. M1454 TaxID=2594477 RepID=UPI0011809A41|nr:bifunctional 4-hydroxy-2-oxoglutarate aldolase/2-dehydro-3-deoxy-phosphogluconate aldolase [Thalassomonas sp. M1454]TRX56822.1 bifunctional 4-hydroxy-2-oxoglutarate aldolase/2-dehydro-3-deoxy-phosphogluconate aldolase [Thalassomonas sp. M1454]
MSLSNNWQIQPAELFAMGPVVPVLVIENVEDAVPIAQALIAGGIKVLEVTLRTANALDVIKEIASKVPEAMVGSGTVTNPETLQQSIDAGAKFALSPGMTTELLAAAQKSSIPLIPGISSISELMEGIDAGFDHFKFFPAEAAGGAKTIKSVSGPFPHVRFCPTGGINVGNMGNYLSLSNVSCIGGSWLVPDDVVKKKDWATITEITKKAVAAATQGK